MWGHRHSPCNQPLCVVTMPFPHMWSHLSVLLCTIVCICAYTQQWYNRQWSALDYDDAITWQPFLHYWTFVLGILWWTVNDKVTKNPIMLNFDVFCVISLSKLLINQLSYQWFEPPWVSCDIIVTDVVMLMAIMCCRTSKEIYQVYYGVFVVANDCKYILQFQEIFGIW